MGWTYRVLDHKADRNTLREIASLGADIPQALIISYNLLPALAGSMVLGSQWQTHTLIADEAHQLTNKRTQWAEMFRMIHRERTILLTATPMRNRLRSLWGLLDCACYGAFGSEWEFRKHFCGATMGDYGLEDGDPTHQDELALRLTEVVLKRTRAQVQIPLPVHTRHVVEVPIPPRLIMGTLTTLQRGNAEAIRALGALRVAIGQAKAVDALAMLDDLVDVHGRVILWVWHHAVADILQEWKRPGVEVDVLLGDTNTKKRSRIIEEWRTGDHTKPRVLVASIGAAATAIALTTAKAAVFVELDWTPMNLIQAEKRHYRFGNVFPEISTTYLVAPMVGAERQMIAALLEKAEASELALDVDGSVDQMRALLAEEPPTEKSLVDRWLKEVRS
jgi:SNF2 family DNA or RNA helicase